MTAKLQRDAGTHQLTAAATATATAATAAAAAAATAAAATAAAATADAATAATAATATVQTRRARQLLCDHRRRGGVSHAISVAISRERGLLTALRLPCARRRVAKKVGAAPGQATAPPQRSALPQRAAAQLSYAVHRRAR